MDFDAPDVYFLMVQVSGRFEFCGRSYDNFSIERSRVTTFWNSVFLMLFIAFSIVLLIFAEFKESIVRLYILIMYSLLREREKSNQKKKIHC